MKFCSSSCSKSTKETQKHAHRCIAVTCVCHKYFNIGGEGGLAPQSFLRVQRHVVVSTDVPQLLREAAALTDAVAGPGRLTMWLATLINDRLHHDIECTLLGQDANWLCVMVLSRSSP